MAAGGGVFDGVGEEGGDDGAEAGFVGDAYEGGGDFAVDVNVFFIGEAGGDVGAVVDDGGDFDRGRVSREFGQSGGGIVRCGPGSMRAVTSCWRRRASARQDSRVRR